MSKIRKPQFIRRFWSFDTDKWYHPLYRRFGFVRFLVWKWAGRKCKKEVKAK